MTGPSERVFKVLIGTAPGTRWAWIWECISWEAAQCAYSRKVVQWRWQEPLQTAECLGDVNCWS